MCSLEVIRERRKVDCHFLRFGRFSKQIFAGPIVGRLFQTPGGDAFREAFHRNALQIIGRQGRGYSLRAMRTRR
jgi:hypothetical protein